MTAPRPPDPFGPYAFTLAPAEAEAAIAEGAGDLVGMTRALIADGVISGGMIPKAEACLRALETTDRVHIVNGHEPHVLIRELLTHQGAGTMIERTKVEQD